jgi:hypothetical protein
MDRVGVQPNRQARAQRSKRSLRRIGGGVVAQQAGRLVDDVGRQVADVVGVAELAFGHRLAFQGLDDLGVGLAVGDQLFQPVFVDRGQAACKHCFLSDRGHQFSSLGAGYRTVCFLHEACQTPRKQKCEVLKPLSPRCLRIDQPRVAQSRCSCQRIAIILNAERCGLMNAPQFG